VRRAVIVVIAGKFARRARGRALADRPITGDRRLHRDARQVPRRGTCKCVRAGFAVPRSRRWRAQRGFRAGHADRVGGAAGSSHEELVFPASLNQGNDPRAHSGRVEVVSQMTRARGPSRQLVSRPARHAQRSPRTAGPARTHLQVSLRATCWTSCSASCWGPRHAE
jgi:hypothetical protein